MDQVNDAAHAYLRTVGATTSRRLAEHLGVKRRAAARRLARLERAGLVERLEKGHLWALCCPGARVERLEGRPTAELHPARARAARPPSLGDVIVGGVPRGPR